MFADDFKLFTKINGIQDCVVLQMCLDLACTWCTENRLKLNIAKCKVVSYTRRNQTTYFDYNINGSVLERVDSFKDLGVVFDNRLTFVKHITEIITKAYKTYGFIYRNCSDFHNESTLKLLFCSLVRSRLEYGAVIWSPIYAVHRSSLEAVQRKFLKWLAFKQDAVYPPQGFNHSTLLDRCNI